MKPETLSRREFLQRAARMGLGAGIAGLLLDDPTAFLDWMGTGGGGDALASDPLRDLLRRAPRARYWISTASGESGCGNCHDPAEIAGRENHAHDTPRLVKCLLCAQECLIPPGERGLCNTRMNDGGVLKSLVYGRPVSLHIDPIEKKPFYNFLPGRMAFSMATTGCALHCKFCQNWEISQARPEDMPVGYVPPEKIVEAADKRSAPVIAFTYNEPTVFTEYLTDIARLAGEQDIRSVLISCGFMTEAPLREMCGCLDAIKIDLKGFSPDFYHTVCGAELEPVLRSIRQVARSGVHLELVNLVVPTLNDSPKMLDDLCAWVAGELSPDVPVHFTRFHPDYQLRNLPPTPVATLERAYDIAQDHGIRYPYVGNVPGHPGNNTLCPGCGTTLIRRRAFLIEENRLRDGRCPDCGASVAGVWI